MYLNFSSCSFIY